MPESSEGVQDEGKRTQYGVEAVEENQQAKKEKKLEDQRSKKTSRIAPRERIANDLSLGKIMGARNSLLMKVNLITLK